jgi:chromosome segregation ATPase
MIERDIVERLRQRDEYEQVLDHANRPYGLAKSLEHDAADEIERLRAERDEAQAEANAGRQAEHDADQERDEAMAERDRLRRAWLRVIQHENQCPASGGCLAKRCGCVAEMEMLIGETGHE